MTQAPEPRKRWFAVKGLFRWYRKKTRETINIEERIVLIEAADFDDAIQLAEQNAAIYCAKDKGANFQIEAMPWWNAYLIGDDPPTEGIEIYSRLIDTSLSADAYVRRYYPKSQDRGNPNK
ncbi:MAG TPA: DUF4288 domain-containing protein [Stellaceae bacterium]|nr:DUF4288 domain-containing protein [Stellaceae bacterium]